MPACDVVRAQADADLVVPDLDRMIPIATAPGWRIRNRIDVVHEDVDMVDFLSDLLEQGGDLIVVSMIALDRATGTARFVDLPCRGVDRSFSVADGSAGQVNRASSFT